MRVIARMNVGGPARQVIALQRGIDSGNFDTRLIIGAVEPTEADQLELSRIDLPAERLPTLTRSPAGIADLRVLAALIARCREFRPDIVHTHTAKAGVLGRLAALRSGVPATVHTFHGHLLHGYFSPSVTRAVVRAERALAKRTTALVAVGSRVRDELVDAGIGVTTQYSVIPPGLQLPSPVPRLEARAALGVASDACAVAYVARLTAVKRPDRFAAFAAILSTSMPEVVFLVAGDGPELTPLRDACAVRGVRVSFLGWRSDVETVYSAADLVVLCSDNEGMPVSLIEAGACGCPAVSTDAGSVSEVVLDGETGFVTEMNAWALAASAEVILRNPDVRESFGRAARVHALSRFSDSRLVADHEELYRALYGRETAERAPRA